jgi:hypothetical protein
MVYSVTYSDFFWRAITTIVPVIFMLSAIPVLVTCSSAYSNAEYGFSYDPPPGWTTDTSQSSGELVSFKDPASPAMISITANTSAGTSLGVLVAASKSDITQQQQVPFQLISEKPVVIGTEPGYELLYGASLMGIGLREKMEFVIRGKTSFVFFLTEPSTGPGPAEQLFDASISSITFASTGNSGPASSPAARSTLTETGTRQTLQSPTAPVRPSLPAQSPVDPGIVLFGLGVAGAVMRGCRTP